MDSFRSDKQSGRRTGSSLDKVIASGKSNRFRQTNSTLRKQPTQSFDLIKSRLDNFNVPDGFHSVAQPTLQTSTRVSNRPDQDQSEVSSAGIDVPTSSKRAAKKHHWGKIIFGSFILVCLVAVAAISVVAFRGIWKTRHIF